jgi:hypothetical protein
MQAYAQDSDPSAVETPREHRDATGRAPAAFDLHADRDLKLQVLSEAYRIRPAYAGRLGAVRNFDVVVLCDDSGSMKSFVNRPLAPLMNTAGRRNTRWDELRNYVSVVVEMATAVGASCDVHFLNRPAMRRVTSAAQLMPAFAAEPAGFTPASAALEFIWSEKAVCLRERALLVIFATDGNPTDRIGNPDAQRFLCLVRAKPVTCFMTILAFNDDKRAVAFLDELVDRKKMAVPGVSSSFAARMRMQPAYSNLHRLLLAAKCD